MIDAMKKVLEIEYGISSIEEFFKKISEMDLLDIGIFTGGALNETR